MSDKEGAAALYELIQKAATLNSILVIAPPGMPVSTAIEALHGHAEATLIIIAEEEGPVPGDKSVLN